MGMIPESTSLTGRIEIIQERVILGDWAYNVDQQQVEV